MKNDNQFTINLNDEYKAQIMKLAEIHQRKPAELLRLLLQPVIISEYAKIQAMQHPINAQPLQQAIFKK